MLDYFEQLINALVYELYFPAELQALPFAPLLQAENLPVSDEIKGDQIAELRSLFAQLSHPDHPLRQNCDPCGICKAARFEMLDVKVGSEKRSPLKLKKPYLYNCSEQSV